MKKEEEEEIFDIWSPSTDKALTKKNSKCDSPSARRASASVRRSGFLNEAPNEAVGPPPSFLRAGRSAAQPVALKLTDV